MNILGLDMSTRKTGWAIFEDGNLKSYNLIEIKGDDIDKRTAYMYDKIQELITTHDIDIIVCEDVPVSAHSNLNVGKNLCILQGCLLTIAHSMKIPLIKEHPTSWRARIGINKTEYLCNKCGNSFIDISGLNFKRCPKCDCSDCISKTPLNDRNQLKERAVSLVNELFGTNLSYFGKYSKKNDDDIAEAILVGYSYLKGME